MFTGIVEEIGSIVSAGPVDGGYQLRVKGVIALQEIHLGDSISINGTCLTVVKFDETTFTVGLAPETLRRTNLGELKAGDLVNLERAMSGSTRFGGHFVQGHVDGTGTILEFRPDADSLWLTIGVSRDLIRYIVPKGYIAVDGTSLTVVDVFNDVENPRFTLMLIAFTQKAVVIPLKKVGDKVNLEVDMLGKYVEQCVVSMAQHQDGFLQTLIGKMISDKLAAK